MTTAAASTTPFPSLNRGYNSVFRAGKLSLGLVVPVTEYTQSRVPDMHDQARRIKLAETLGFSAVWLRDVPFDVPSFGDAGQLYDPFVYLGLLAGQTEKIALGVASIILPLRHPAHVAKAAASVDALSGGRLILGVASGDRPDEYPALNIPYDSRGQRFRESFEYIRTMSETAPPFDNDFGSSLGGIDMLPKPTAGSIPMLVTGGSQQNPDWVAQHGDGWMTYPRNLDAQAHVIQDWQQRVEAAGRAPQPVLQTVYIDLAENPDTPPQPIHLGMRLGMNHLLDYVKSLEAIGVNHLALNLRFNQADIDQTLHRLADDLLPHFHD
ncbi:LLM class oxidoreductase [Algisphaera agarilytica]|uniref:Luciferase-type oxidoreductase n=1 Tax=Algisphaera agarilytica TaxID=1385975 RepID=A0A7X0H6S4_9BACT|nr:LLM class oxidoreductase [Algisphaera agarilytica]MBB6430331.1 luciferase-type oxidoreductase [Algisphaera agarilytica]